MTSEMSASTKSSVTEMTVKEQRLRIYFATWNVATKFPVEDPRGMLDVPGNGQADKAVPDFYFIGLQEVNSQPQNMVLHMMFEDPWSKVFRDVLKEHDYVKVKTQRLQGLVLNCFCLRKHLSHIRLMEAQYTKTGFKGMWGNKGAVSIRLNIYGVSICVVNTHLTPHDHLLAERILDYNTIVANHTFSAPDTSKILYHDYVFWIGDLNFRLNNLQLTSIEIDALVKRKQLKGLLEQDQLKSVRETGEAFAELIEELVTFPPTYKYEFSSQEFDLKRRPSWTDRILYKVNADVYDDTKLIAVQHNYKSHPSYVQSDHKPVTAEFDIIVRPDMEHRSVGLSSVTDGMNIGHQRVEFPPIADWFIDEENSVSYRLLGDARPASRDWIGLFREDFSTLDEYLVYEYAGRCKTSPVPSGSCDVTERIFFGNNALCVPGMYCLVYVAERDGLVGILGISSPFRGCFK